MTHRWINNWIFSLQILSVAFIWVFVLGITVWILNLLQLSRRLHDVPSASVGISIVAIPVFWLGAAVLTYVFIGLRRGRRPRAKDSADPGRALLVSGLLLGLAAPALADGSAAVAWPDNPLRGRLVFEQKQCVRCHAISEDRPGAGPTLGEGRFRGSFLELGAALWNHVPGMSVALPAEAETWPELSEGQVTELMAFLFFVDYLGRPGDASAGKRAFESKGCARCHEVGAPGDATVGPDLADLRRFVSPLYLAQAVWNHGPSMFEAMRSLGVPLPDFRNGDLADMSAFLRGRGRPGPVERMLLSPGNPNAGRARFSDKGCALCHGEGGTGGSGGPDLRDSELGRSGEGIAAAMWNHGPAMRATMAARGIGWPSFTTHELADLVAFLYFLPFDDPPGDPELGRRAFAARGCGDCHEAGARTTHPGPELFGAAATRSPAALVGAMWNHAPVMKEAVLEEGQHWPELSGRELRDLYAYLAAGPAVQP